MFSIAIGLRVLGVMSLLQGTTLDSEQQEYVSTAQRSGHLLLELVNDILDFSALDSGRIAIETGSFSVARLMADVDSMFGASAAANDVTIDVEIAESVSDFVSGDENRMQVDPLDTQVPKVQLDLLTQVLATPDGHPLPRPLPGKPTLVAMTGERARRTG